MDADAPMAVPPPPRWLTVVAVLLLAANLRASVNVVGPLLPAIRASLNLTGVQAGVVTAMPTICFAVLSVAGARIAAVFGPKRAVLASLALLTIGQVLRAAIPSLAAMVAGTALAMSAIAVTNVLMPALIAANFPERIPLMTSAYTVTLAGAGAVASAGTLPIQHALGGTWRLGIGMWAALAALAAGVWLDLARRHHVSAPRQGDRLKAGEVARSPRAWVLAGFFGLQAFQAYIAFLWFPTILMDAGVPLGAAAAYVGGVSLASMAGSVAVPGLMARTTDQRPLVALVSLGFVIGYLGTMLAPTTLTWLWALLIGVGTSSFPMGLYLVTQRAATHAGVLALSGFMQGVGYLVAGVSLILFGAWRGDSTDWTTALILLMGVTVVQMLAGFVSVTGWVVEDDIDGGPARLRR